MTNDQKRAVIGKICYHAILDYINDVRDAAYPQTAEQVGGYAYEHFLEVLKQVTEIAEKE